MSVRIIQERLESYQSESWQAEEMAVKEIYQEVALAALSRTGFFKWAAFQGGTALRVLYGLDRFSEDLDFLLKKPDSKFELKNYIKTLVDEFRIYGIPVSTQDRSKGGDTIQKLFLKQESSGMVLALRHHPREGRPQKIKIKIEVDTNPPAGSRSDVKYLDFPFPFGVTVQDLPSLFAGKSHALLTREYTKGRDWYDFLWYVARKTPINFTFLSRACEQVGPWQGRTLNLTKKWYLAELAKKIESTDWIDARNDVHRFLKPHELETLKLWGRDLFLDRLAKMETYLSE